MNKSLENKIKELKGQFDIEMPNVGHFERFKEKLDVAQKPKSTIWKPLAIAASLLLLLSFSWNYLSEKERQELKEVSPKMAETQAYFTSVLSQELKAIDKVKNLENKKIIDDGMAQLKILENDYLSLTIQLQVSNEDSRIIFAMIDNFQKRIEVLKSVLNQINITKQTKNNSYENKFI